MASKKFLMPIDLAKNEIQQAVAQVLASDPSTPVTGQFWYNSTSGRLKFRGAAANIDPTDRSTHTGTQLAATISDFATQVQATRIDQLSSPTAAVAFNAQRITGLADPTSAQDAATKNYVDTTLSAAANVNTLKGAVRAAVTTNVNIAAPGTTLDGLTAANGDIFLLTGQTTGSQNGPYVFNGSAAAMTRALNWDVQAETVVGSYWIVTGGTSADRFAILSNDTFTLGTTTATFVYTGAGTAYSAGTGLTLTGSVFAIDGTVVPRKFSQTIGDGTSTSIAVTHNLGTQDITYSVRDASTNAFVDCDVTATTTNVATFVFSPTAPALNSLRVTIHG